MQLLIFGLALISYFGIHSLLANNVVKARLMKEWIPKKYYRLGYNFVAIISLIPLFFFYKKIDTQLLFDSQWLSLLGAILILLGIVIIPFALKQYNLSEFTGFQQYKQKSSPAPEILCTTGLNAIVRHPLYFATLIILWGYFLFRPTDLFLTLAIITSLYTFVGTKLEEQKLIEEFGEAYLIYQKEVGMLLPFLK